MKKLIAAILALSLFAALLCFPTVASTEIAHPNYMNGNADGFFHPHDSVTRAEMAQIIVNLYPNYQDGSSAYTDVSQNAWYEDAVSALSSAGVLAGYPDGTFRPMKSVSRAEFIKILASLSGKEPTVHVTSFHDVSTTHWAFSAIALAESSGWLESDASLFRPDEAILRVEAVRILNAFLGRIPDKNAIDHNSLARYFPDVTPEDDFYYDVMEATIAHTATITMSGEAWGAVTRYKTALPDGFVVFAGTLRIVKDGLFLKEQTSGVLSGIRYTTDEDGVVSVTDGPVFLAGGNWCVVVNGVPCTDDGLHCTQRGLYCLKSGNLLADDDYGAYDKMHFSSNGKYTSGNETIDSYINGIVKEIITPEMTAVDRLRACYDYVYNNVSYRANNNHVERGALASEWCETYMLRLIDTGKGNCYCYAAEMYYLARRVGWESATAVSGGVTPDNLDHGWITVTADGEILMLDPELDTSSGPFAGSCFLVTYKEAPFRYYP